VFKESLTLIVIFVDSKNLGGIETHILHLAKGLNQFNYENEVWFYRKYNQGHPLEEQFKSNQINFSYLDGSLTSLLARLAENNVDILHSHGYKANILARLAKIIFQTRVVTTFHNGDLGQGKLKLYTAIDLITSKISENIAVNKEISNRLHNKCTLINNFIDISTAKISSGKEIAFVGRLSYEKGPDNFLELAKRHKELNFCICGDGPMKNELLELSPKNLTFAGQVKNMDAVWPKIELLCITSRTEGLPMVALEAMCRGIPIISFDVGGMSQVIEHNYNGWLIAQNDIETMSYYLINWFNLDSRAKNIIKNRCIQTIEASYSSKSVIPQVVKLYTKLISKG
jgi:glycosyltransferase involved in cell wall biosynthesis